MFMNGQPEIGCPEWVAGKHARVMQMSKLDAQNIQYEIEPPKFLKNLIANLFILGNEKHYAEWNNIFR